MAELKRIVGKTYIGLLVCLLVFNMLILVSDKTDDLQVTYAYIEMLNTAEGVKSDSKLSTEAATIAWNIFRNMKSMAVTVLTRQQLLNRQERS
jgi:hypothetical protein